jgi:hypothetical protein
LLEKSGDSGATLVSEAWRRGLGKKTKEVIHAAKVLTTGRECDNAALVVEVFEQQLCRA